MRVGGYRRGCDLGECGQEKEGVGGGNGLWVDVGITVGKETEGLIGEGGETWVDVGEYGWEYMGKGRRGLLGLVGKGKEECEWAWVGTEESWQGKVGVGGCRHHRGKEKGGQGADRCK